MDSQTYNLYISSSDKISGTNNNAVFFVNWSSFLPQKYQKYKVRYAFQSVSGWYVDSANSTYNTCKIVADFNCGSSTYDTATSGQSKTLGFANRDLLQQAPIYNTFSSPINQSPEKTISTPNQGNINIQLYNTGLQNYTFNQLLVSTDVGGIPETDCTGWNLILEFTPLLSSEITV